MLVKKIQYCYIQQLNLVDNRIMRPGLPHILLFHEDLDFHSCRDFFVVKLPIGGTTCQLTGLTVMDVMDLERRRSGIF